MNPVPFILIIVSLPLLLGGCGEKHEGISLDELQNRGKNGYFEKNQEVGYTGKVFKLHENGQKSQEANWKDGKKEGLNVKWHDNGQKQYEANFKDHKLDGLTTSWHKNGQKRSEVNYKDGELISKKYWNSKGEPVDSEEEADKE